MTTCPPLNYIPIHWDTFPQAMSWIVLPGNMNILDNLFLCNSEHWTRTNQSCTGNIYWTLLFQTVKGRFHIISHTFKTERSDCTSTSSKGIPMVFLCSTVRLFNSGMAHQKSSGTSVMKSWLNAQKPQGMQAGKQIRKRSSFWYRPNSPIIGSSSSKSKESLGGFEKKIFELPWHHLVQLNHVFYIVILFLVLVICSRDIRGRWSFRHYFKLIADKHSTTHQLRTKYQLTLKGKSASFR